MIFHSIVFSLGDPSANWYFYMLLILHKSLIKTGSIRPGDKFVVSADEETIKYGKQFGSLAGIEWNLVPNVKSVKEGMLLKYLFRPKVEDVVVYLDCDFLVTKKITFNLPPDTIAVLPEGSATDTNYCGDFTLNAKFGATAGFFIYRYGPTCERILEEIKEKILTDTKNFFTLDQPWFNYVLQDKPNVAVINQSLVSFNGHGNLKEASLINCAGIPGAGAFHYGKMINFFMMMV